MKRALAITLTVAMIGALAFMGLAGTAAAQEEVGDVNINDSVFQDQDQEQTTGDASVDVSVDQNNNNAQVGSATAGDAVALSDGGGAGAAGAAAHDKGGTAGAAGTADAGGATAASMAETNQAQDVTQVNNADVDATAESGDNIGVQAQVAADDVDDNDVDEENDFQAQIDDLQDQIDAITGAEFPEDQEPGDPIFPDL